MNSCKYPLHLKRLKQNKRLVLIGLKAAITKTAEKLILV